MIYDEGARPSSTITCRPLIQETDENGDVGTSQSANEKINVTSSVISVTQKAEERNGGREDAVKYSAAMDDAEEAIKSAAKDTRAALDRLADAMGGKVTDGKRAFQAAKDKARFDRAARAFLYAADGNVQALDHVQGVRLGLVLCQGAGSSRKIPKKAAAVPAAVPLYL